MIGMRNMAISDDSSAPPFSCLSCATDFSSALETKPVISPNDRDPDLLTRGLAMDFPLHSISELRRTIAEAQQDLWPHRDPIDILDRARERLHEGLIG